MKTLTSRHQPNKTPPPKALKVKHHQQQHAPRPKMHRTPTRFPLLLLLVLMMIKEQIRTQ